MVDPAQANLHVSSAWVERYLTLLGLEREEPGAAALARIAEAHTRRVVFANVSSLLRRRANSRAPVPPIDCEALLADWEAERGGGVCFEVVELLSRLLVALGYHARPALGRISFPGSHQAVLVEVDGGRYLVDAGNGAPFFAPIPLGDATEVRHAGLAYRFRPGESDRFCVQDRWIDGGWAPFCTYDLDPPDLHMREAAYQQHHTPGQSWVVDSLTLIRCTPEEVCVLRNAELTRFRDGGKETRPVEGIADYERLIADVFALPSLPIAEVLQAWGEVAGT
jgi:arylamine N-acetyltransferase